MSTIDTQQSIADGICQGQRETRAAGVFDEDDRADANDAYDIPMDDDCCFTGLNQECLEVMHCRIDRGGRVGTWRIFGGRVLSSRVRIGCILTELHPLY